MKKILAFLCASLIVSLVVFPGTTNAYSLYNENEINYTERYQDLVSPVYSTTETSAWKTMSRPARMAACQLTGMIIQELSTSELLLAVLEFPFFIDIFAYDDMLVGYSCVYSECCALKAFMERDDAIESIISFYEKIPVPRTINSAINEKNYSILWKTELLLEYSDLIADMTTTQKQALLDILHYKETIKSKSPTVYQTGKSGVIEKIIDSDENLRTQNEYVYTPNGSPVLVYKWTNSDVDFNTTQINLIHNDMAAAYPNATKLSNPTKKYNCHSYAWYSQSTSNVRWMDDPSLYMSDGSYSQVTKLNTSVGDRLVYYYPIDSGETGISHSSIIYSYTDYPRSRRTFVVESKWGKAGLYRHSVGDDPYLYFGGSISPANIEYYH